MGSTSGALKASRSNRFCSNATTETRSSLLALTLGNAVRERQISPFFQIAPSPKATRRPLFFCLLLRATDY